MGLLVAFGDDANFVLSVGGFHPRFTPPPLPFPSPKRICARRSSTRLRAHPRRGATSPSRPTPSSSARTPRRSSGSRRFSVEGNFGFDALFQFSPFYFDRRDLGVVLASRCSGVGVFSVQLRGSLEGPTPWQHQRHGARSRSSSSTSRSTSTAPGASVAPTSLPPIAVLPLLRGEFEKHENWRALLAGASTAARHAARARTQPPTRSSCTRSARCR